MPPVRILVADGDEQRLQTLLRTFAQDNIQVDGSSKFIDILKLLDEGGADLLLVDIDTMRLQDQAPLLTIRDNFPNLPIVGLSNSPPAQARRRAMRFCLDRLVTRPIFPERVITLFPTVMRQYLCPTETC